MKSRTIRTGEVELHCVEEGNGPLVVLSHGFPELAFSWRHQLPALSAAGYRAIAPDQRGYGRTSRPDAVEDYDIRHLSADLVAVLDALGEEKAVFVGHDWGSMVVSHVALLHPGRVAGLVNMSVPHLPRGPVAPVEAMRAAFAGMFFYILYFQEPGVADRELAADPARTVRRLLAGARQAAGDMPDPESLAADGRGFVDRFPEPLGLPGWLTRSELDHYIAEFSRTGFTGGLNWYRNLDRNWATTEDLAGARVTTPSLYIGGALDPVVKMSPPGLGGASLTDHRGDVLVEEAGHWVQQEQPQAVNRHLIAFLDSIYRRTP